MEQSVLLNILLFIAGGALGGGVVWSTIKARASRHLEVQLAESHSSIDALRSAYVEQSFIGPAGEIKPRDQRSTVYEDCDDYDTRDWTV